MTTESIIVGATTCTINNFNLQFYYNPICVFNDYSHSSDTCDQNQVWGSNSLNLQSLKTDNSQSSELFTGKTIEEREDSKSLIDTLNNKTVDEENITMEDIVDPSPPYIEVALTMLTLFAFNKLGLSEPDRVVDDQLPPIQRADDYLARARVQVFPMPRELNALINELEVHLDGLPQELPENFIVGNEAEIGVINEVEIAGIND